jgi:hypothetical protein
MGALTYVNRSAKAKTYSSFISRLANRYNVGLLEVGSERCRQKHYVPNVTAKGPHTAPSVEALVRNPPQVSASETAILATELVAAAAMFAVARAKLSRQTKRRQFPRITVLLEAPHDPFGNPRFPQGFTKPAEIIASARGFTRYF